MFCVLPFLTATKALPFGVQMWFMIVSIIPFLVFVMGRLCLTRYFLRTFIVKPFKLLVSNNVFQLKSSYFKDNCFALDIFLSSLLFSLTLNVLSGSSNP